MVVIDLHDLLAGLGVVSWLQEPARFDKCFLVVG